MESDNYSLEVIILKDSSHFDTRIQINLKDYSSIFSVSSSYKKPITIYGNLEVILVNCLLLVYYKTPAYNSKYYSA